MAYIGFAPATKPLTANDLSDGIVTTATIADGAVISLKIADGNVISSKIADGNVISSKIADGNVITSKIADGNVISSKIADGNVITSKIADANVLTSKIALANVTSEIIANANVRTHDIELANITNELLIDDAVSSSKIAPLVNLQEDTSLVAAAFDATTNIDLLTNSVYYNPNAADTNFKVNFRADASTSLNSIMAIGNTISAAIMVTNAGTPYYINAHEVDGSSVTPKYQGGTAYSAGNANSIDIYTFSIIKTADATFTLIAAQTKHA